MTSDIRSASRITKLLCFPTKGMQKAVEGLTTLSVCVLGCLEESKAKIVYSERKAGSAIIPASSCLIQCNKQRYKNKTNDEKQIIRACCNHMHAQHHNGLVPPPPPPSFHPPNNMLLGKIRNGDELRGLDSFSKPNFKRLAHWCINDICYRPQHTARLAIWSVCISKNNTGFARWQYCSQ